MTFPRYPKYKDSGVEWLGHVPEHWDVVPLKNVASIINGYPFDSAMFDPSEGFPLVRIRDLGQSETESKYRGEFVERAAITAEDVLIGMDGDFNVGRWRGQGRALLNQRMCCVRGRDNFVTRLLEYVLPTPLKAINDVTYSTTVKHLASNQVEKTFVAIPPLESDLKQIVSFLDRETAKIDALIAEQQRLIELLNEKRQAVISHTVTKGLNPNAPMKPSGIEWLGDVPAHWKMTKLRWLFQQAKRQDQSDKTVLSVYRDYGVIRKDSRDDNMNKTPDDLSAYQLVNVGDLVVNKMKAWQGSLGISALEGITSPDYVVFVPQHHESSKFLHLLLRAQTMASVYRSISNGIRPAQWRLEPEPFLALPVFLPPLAEQQQIVSYLESVKHKFSELANEAERAISLLEERRTALISAAVTGQIDVRGLALLEAA